MIAYVGLGSNLGPSRRLLAEAAQRLGALPGLQLGRVSPLYRTEPQGLKDQPWFLNQVLALEPDASWSPRRLLQSLLAVEHELGRQRPQPLAEAEETPQRFGPRCIDLDLLLFGNTVCSDSELTLPHPRMRERAFVLVPLYDIAPELVFPDGQTLGAALAGIRYRLIGDCIHQD